MTGRAAQGRSLLAAALVAVAGLCQAASPAPVAAASGLSFTSVGTWRPDMAGARVHVSLRITATSKAPADGARRYYYAGLQLTMPPSSAGYKAADDRGRALPVRVLASSPLGIIVDAAFPQRLYAGQTGSFNFEFDLVDSGGSTDRDLHIGRDVASFPVVAFGSPETPGSSVTVVFPPGYSVQEPFGNLTSRVDETGQTIYSSGVVPDATAVNAWFTASLFEPSADHEVRFVTVAPLQVALRYWADDPAWADQVERILLAGYPVLRDLIGRGDPRFRTLTLEESTTRGIGGFSGEYDRAEGVVRISYFADPMVVLHELAHLWFDDSLASERWIDEGFASYYAEQAILKLGLPNHAPQLSGALMAAATPLQNWAERGDPGSAREAYLYAASLQAAREIGQFVGQEKLRRVWNWARSGAGPYDRPPSPGEQPDPNGPAQPTGAPADPTDPLATPPAGATPRAGVSPSPPIPPGPQAPALDWRRLLDYVDQAADSSLTEIWRSWVVTPGSLSLLAEREAALSEYRRTQTLAGQWGLPPDIRLAMTNWQFGHARELLGQARGVLGLRDQIEAGARAEQTTAPPTLRRVFEEVSTSAAQTQAWHELAVLSELSAARLARTSGNGAARIVGLLGADPDAQLDEARQAFAEGELDEAARLAVAARSAWSQAAGSGQVRLMGASMSLIGALILLALYRVRRRDEDAAA